MRFVYQSLLFLFILLAACMPEMQGPDSGSSPCVALADSLPKVEVHHARGFTVQYENGVKRVTVVNPSDSSQVVARYLLVQRGCTASARPGETLIEIPLRSIACVSTTHLPFLTLLGEEEKLVGFAGCKYVQNPTIRQRIEAGEVREIGSDHELNAEQIIALYPSALMVYPYEGQNYTAIEKAHIPLLYNSEYLELTPLGKAEWIKFTALFFNREREANAQFDAIEKEYLSLRAKAAEIKVKPMALSGKPQKGKWYVPAGRSFAAAFMLDAGAVYPWQHDTGNNVIPLDAEVVIDKALYADWWVIVGMHPGHYTLADLLAEDPRFARFEAFRKKQVIFCNAAETDYFGDAVAEPHILLKDLLYYFHPSLVPDYRPQYFYRLE